MNGGRLSERQRQVGYMHPPGLALHLNTLAGQFVQRDAFSFQRGVHGRSLPGVAHKSLLDLSQQRRSAVWNRRRAGDRPGAVERIGLNAELQRSGIGLPFGHEELRELGAGPQAEGQQTAGKGVKRAEMANFFDPQRLFENTDHLRRCRPLGLVDEEETIKSGH